MNIANYPSPNTLTKRIPIKQHSSNKKGLTLLISSKISILNIKFLQPTQNSNKNTKLPNDNNLKKKGSLLLNDKNKRSSFEEDDQANLEKLIKEKREKLEKSMISEKESQKLNELEGLIGKWRKAGQEALTDLLAEFNKYTDERKELGDLMNAFKFDRDLLHYDEKNGEFY